MASKASISGNHRSLESILAGPSVVMLRLARDGTVRDVHVDPRTDPGLEPEACVGRRLGELIDPELDRRISHGIVSVLDGGRAVTLDHEPDDSVGGGLEVRIVPLPADEVFATISRVGGHRMDDRRFLDIAGAVSSGTGESFFRSLVGGLCRFLDADIAFVARVIPERDEMVETIAVQVDDDVQSNFAYGLPGTPCADVMRQGACIFAHNVQEQFPEDELLVKMGVHAYVGIPLFDSHGTPIGLIVVLYRAPLESTRFVESTLRIFASRTAAELERRCMEEALREQLRFEGLVSRLSAHFINLAVEDVDQEIEAGLGTIGRLIDVDRSYVFQYSDDQTRMSCTHEWCADGVAPGVDRLQDVPCDLFPWAMGKHLAGESITVPRVAELPPEASAEKAEFLAQEIRSLVSAPLIVSGTVRGFVGFDSVREERRWRARTVGWMKLVGEIFATALERRRSVEEMSKRLRFEALISELSTTLINLPAERIDDLIVIALEVFGRFLGFDRAHVFQFFDEHQFVKGTHEWSDEGIEPVEPSVQAVPCDLFAWSLDQIVAGGALVIERAEELPPEAAAEAEMFSRLSTRSGVFTPLTMAGSVEGFVGFCAVRSHCTWSEETITWMKLLSEILANALQRKRVEESLAESRERFRGLVESTSDWVWEIDEHNIYTYCSPVVERLLGHRPDEVLGRTPFDLMPAAEATRVSELFEEIQAAREPFTRLENVNLHEDGRRVVLETSGVPCFDRDGTFRGFRGIDRDVTRRRQLEQEVRIHREQLNAFFTLAPYGLAIWDDEFRFAQINETLAVMDGMSVQEHLGKTIQEALPDIASQITPGLRRVVETGQPLVDVPVQRPSPIRPGTIQYAEVTFFPVAIEGSEARGVGAIVVDVSERRAAEQQLIQYQDQLRSLASEISLAEERERRRIAVDLHDRIVQILGLTKMKLGGLQKSWPEGEGRPELGEVRSLVEQTIQDTRSLVFELSPPILYELGFEPAVEWLTERMHEQHGVAASLHDDGRPKPLDEDVQIVLFQAVRELLVNVAKHAQASTATISLGRRDDRIEIVVEDDGVGCDISYIGAHPTEAGGFGLFSIRDRLHLLGGRLSVESKPDAGTRITLTAPLRSESEVAL